MILASKDRGVGGNKTDWEWLDEHTSWSEGEL